ncbi:putative phospholipase [Phytophthora cinnamomi]|uniref:putative phospholipase n=1 Tax=Phytophthora cinnamomi TaxID=4785 RepID=UPI00355AC991|nr:putative phospholipase [Phytophthora cinnamomi]
MFGVLQTDNSDGEGDEEYEDGAFHFEDSEAERDAESEVGELDDLALGPEEEEASKKTAKRDAEQTEITYPVSFSQVGRSPRFGEAKAAFCDLEVGVMLFCLRPGSTK